ncbi:hypothetical protein SS37A_20130 [Methylocystis iwaonis]|uniref:Uncharacterized protein n=1 Tax=Methylocystis iwaonis TaxID=2885079 RepID=A0ABM8E926_9HYPH|nr:hypothetical protein SS37A_20130 [Methylocystis iwaonis]
MRQVIARKAYFTKIVGNALNENVEFAVNLQEARKRAHQCADRAFEPLVLDRAVEIGRGAGGRGGKDGNKIARGKIRMFISRK